MEKRPPVVLQALPFSEACERNKGPILKVLSRWLTGLPRFIVEIGSGTGQHAVHFARHLPHLTWQPTEQAEHLTLLDSRVSIEGPPNLLPPLELDVVPIVGITQIGTCPASMSSSIASASASTRISYRSFTAILRRLSIPSPSVMHALSIDECTCSEQ